MSKKYLGLALLGLQLVLGSAFATTTAIAQTMQADSCDSVLKYTGRNIVSFQYDSWKRLFIDQYKKNHTSQGISGSAVIEDVPFGVNYQSGDDNEDKSTLDDTTKKQIYEKFDVAYGPAIDAWLSCKRLALAEGNLPAVVTMDTMQAYDGQGGSPFADSNVKPEDQHEFIKFTIVPRKMYKITFHQDNPDPGMCEFESFDENGHSTKSGNVPPVALPMVLKLVCERKNPNQVDFVWKFTSDQTQEGFIWPASPSKARTAREDGDQQIQVATGSGDEAWSSEDSAPFDREIKLRAFDIIPSNQGAQVDSVLFSLNGRGFKLDGPFDVISTSSHIVLHHTFHDGEVGVYQTLPAFTPGIFHVTARCFKDNDKSRTTSCGSITLGGYAPHNTWH